MSIDTTNLKEYRFSVDFEVYGDRALFSDPVTRIGGEKCSYHFPTCEALKGIARNIYWKPSFIWVIDYVRVMNPIITEAAGVRVPSYYKEKGKTDLSYHMYLKNVRYQVRAHLESNKNHPEFSNDWNMKKHFEMAKRWLKKGGRRTPFLGTSECFAYFKECEFGSGDGYYDNLPGEMGYGLMYHSFTYPDQAKKINEKNKLTLNFWAPVMMPGGVIEVIIPEECPVKKFIKKMDLAKFVVKEEKPSEEECK